jgi:hypothetical protein
MAISKTPGRKKGLLQRKSASAFQVSKSNGASSPIGKQTVQISIIRLKDSKQH